MPSNARNRNGAARRAVTARLRAEGRPCWICQAFGKPGTIDYSLRFPHPYSFTTDELVPVSRYWLGGYPDKTAAALDYANLAAAHKCCNEWRSNRTVEEVLRLAQRRSRGSSRPPHVEEERTSRDWRRGTRREA